MTQSCPRAVCICDLITAVAYQLDICLTGMADWKEGVCCCSPCQRRRRESRPKAKPATTPLPWTKVYARIYMYVYRRDILSVLPYSSYDVKFTAAGCLQCALRQPVRWVHYVAIAWSFTTYDMIGSIQLDPHCVLWCGCGHPDPPFTCTMISSPKWAHLQCLPHHYMCHWLCYQTIR